MNEAQALQVNGFDLDLLTDPSALTHRVAVAWDADGNETAGFIIVGKDSPQYQQMSERLRAAGIKRGAIRSQRIDTKTDEGAVQLHQLMQKNEFELAVAVVVDWFGFKKGGQPVEFNVHMVRDMLTKKPTWREKITAELEVEANFLPPSLKISSNSPDTNSV